MTLAELIAGLEAQRRQLAQIEVTAEEVDAVVWVGDDTVPVTDLDCDVFEDGGRWVVEIRKQDDP